MDRSQKEALVASMKQAFNESALVVIVHQSGLTVDESTDLRRKVREVGASFKVTKNRLTRLALEGTAHESLKDYFTGPTAIAYGTDPVAAAKVVTDFAKKNDKVTVVGGGLNGQSLDAAGVQALAKLPSLDELRAKLVGMIQTPATRVAGILQQPGGQLARVLNAYATKDEAA